MTQGQKVVIWMRLRWNKYLIFGAWDVKVENRDITTINACSPDA
jgi:hypothetical protein